jgi:hypothetical protein
MDRLGRTAFMKISAAALEIDCPALDRRDDMGAIGVARGDDAATFLNEPMHHREQQPSAGSDQTGDRRAGKRTGVFGMGDGDPAQFAVAEERHLLAPTGKKIGFARLD